jgi:hypothetical protein
MRPVTTKQEEETRPKWAPPISELITRHHMLLLCGEPLTSPQESWTLLWLVIIPSFVLVGCLKLDVLNIVHNTFLSYLLSTLPANFAPKLSQKFVLVLWSRIFCSSELAVTLMSGIYWQWVILTTLTMDL